MGACNSTKNEKKKVEINQREEPIKAKALPNSANRAVEAQSKTEEKTKYLITIKEDSTLLLEEEFDEKTMLKDVYSKIKYDTSCDYDLIDIKSEERLNEKVDMLLKEIFPSNDQVNKIELIVKYTGLDLPLNSKEFYYSNTKYIGSLILDNPEKVGIVVYDTSNTKTITYFYPADEAKEIKHFGPFSAICNGLNKLYISGGETQTDSATSEMLNSFIEIDLSTLSKSSITFTKLPDLNEGRTWHSMIYVPKSYIFIVGGTGSKSVEVYDIVKGKVEKDSELNESRSECTLCLVNNTYLYAFCGFLLHQSYVASIERCNLHRSKRTWEIVHYTTENNIHFSPSFFGVAYYNNDIILLGGNENSSEKNGNYLIKLEDNKTMISDFSLNEELTCVFREKFFIPLNEKTSMVIPYISTKVEIALFNEEEGKVTKCEYKEESNDEII